VLQETTSCGTREEPGTLTQGAPVFYFPGSSRLGIEPKTPGWLVQDFEVVKVKTKPPSRVRRVCVYYCSTYYKAVRVGGGGIVEDMCYERLRGLSGQVWRGLSGQVCPSRTDEFGGVHLFELSSLSNLSLFL
jgi:hypothetical protein